MYRNFLLYLPSNFGTQSTLLGVEANSEFASNEYNIAEMRILHQTRWKISCGFLLALSVVASYPAVKTFEQPYEGALITREGVGSLGQQPILNQVSHHQPCEWTIFQRDQPDPVMTTDDCSTPASTLTVTSMSLHLSQKHQAVVSNFWSTETKMFKVEPLSFMVTKQ